MNVRIGIVAAIVIALAACAKDSPLAPPTQLALGEWGADGAQFVVGDSLIEVSGDCTGGEFPAKDVHVADGRFTVAGTWQIFLGPTVPAQLSGVIAGNTLNFAVAAWDARSNRLLEYGPFEVVHGTHASLVVCP
jgi:hypothetical protein